MDAASVNQEAELEDLVSLWQRRHIDGGPVTAAELCRERPELLPELERRIAVLERMSGLARATHETATLGTAALRRAAPLPTRRPEIPGYEILDELGRGGMGVVYKARHLRLNRIVALKMLLAGGYAGPSESVRFLSEAEVVAALHHPHIVALLEYGEHQGQPFFTLEFMQGGSLAEQLKGIPQPAPAAARLVEQLARAVYHAHTHGIVHRDLKPSNILLAEDGTPKITDFGLARRTTVGAGLTTTGEVLGTPSYMAPEQAGGGAKHASPATDIYALGAILYEYLTGRPPFRAANTMETMLQVIGQEPVTVRQLQPHTPADLATICHKCLQKEPHKRYASALELAEDCAAFLEGKPIRARPITALSRGWRWCRRNRALAGALTLGVVSLLLGSIVTLAVAFRAEAARQSEANRAASEAEAKHEADQARRDAQRQSMDLRVSSGLTAARAGDHSLALLWFARAVQLAKDEPQQEELNRIRIANWLRQVWLPEGTFAVPGFRQNQDRFRTIQFSPAGDYLLIVTDTSTCRVWNRPQGRLMELPGAAAQATAAAWHPENGLLAVAEKDGRIRFLEPPSFRPVNELVAGGEVVVLAYSRDGKRLAWGGTNGARVWDLEENKYLTPLLSHEGAVTSLSFSSRGDRLATAARDGMARVFAVPSQQPEPLFPPVPHTRNQEAYAHQGPDRLTPCFANGDQFLLTMPESPGSTRSLVWRSATTGKVLFTSNVLPDESHLACVTVSPSGKYVAALWGGKGRLFDAHTGQVHSSIRAPPPLIWNEDAAFSSDGSIVATCGHDTKVQFWSVEDHLDNTLRAIFPAIYHPMQAVRVTLSGDGGHAAAALWDGTIYLWRRPAGAPTSYSLATGGPTLPALTPDRKFFLPRGLTYRNGTQKTTRVHEADSGKPAGPKLDPGGILLDATFSPDGRLVATASSTARTTAERNRRLFWSAGKGGNVQIWDWKTGQRLLGPIPTPSEPRGLAFRPDGSMLAVVCADYLVILVDPKTGIITGNLDPGLRTKPQNANQWFSNGEARFSLDGRFLVTWEMTSHVHVWDPDQKQHRFTLPHTERVRSVLFNPAAPEFLATCGWGSKARVWNLTTGELAATLPHPQWLSQIQFAPDGSELITCCDDGLLRVWDWKAEKLKDGWPFHPSTVQDFHFFRDRRMVVSLGHQEMQITDWQTRTPVTPQWDLKPDFSLGMAVPSGDRCALVGGFADSDSLISYDLETMLRRMDAPVEDLVRLAELVAARRILNQGAIVPLSSQEWAERWQQLRDSPSLLESLRPTLDEVRYRQVRRLVASLFEQLVRKAAVLDRLRQDPRLDRELRAEALALGERYVPNAEWLNEGSWDVVRARNRSPENYARALLQAEEACSLEPENGLYRNTLGVAQYRVGKYQEAIDTLTHSDNLNRKTFGDSLPADLAFLSMAQHRFGMKKQALATFERLRQIMSASDQANASSTAADESTRNENHAFFREAEETIVGKDGPSQRDNREKKPLCKGTARRSQAQIVRCENPNEMNNARPPAVLPGCAQTT
jgi:WD40 repeat protein/tetratricopeptide (TPR) repeat protein